ncbi:DUF3987 domain-containing protein [Leptolyngbya sp. DQ-M1]|uniref:DUF3987 domain-containing protein n=1 Tax=Leptolyngbya sp. DQ-M1 TaxID=2933920 RepID=UPI00329A0B2E
MNLPSNRNFCDFPQEWRFTPIAKGGKAPIGQGWQNKPFQWQDVIRLFSKTYQDRQVSAVGVISGEVSGGLLLLDHDGSSCEKLLSEWGQVPQTWKVSSGKPGHYQLAFTVPKTYWGAIATRKYRTGAIDKDGKHEQIELRWNGCQSLVFGEHPETHRNYEWTDIGGPIAEAPLCVIEKMLKPELEHSRQQQHLQKWSDQDWANSYLGAIDPNPLDWYTWRDCLFAAHEAGLSEHEARSWSNRSTKHTDKGFDAVWQHIKGNKIRSITLGTLGYLAKQNGWTSPFPRRENVKANRAQPVLEAVSVAKMPIEQLQAEVSDLCELSLSQSDLSAKILSLAERSGRQSKDVWGLYTARQTDLSESDNVSSINELLSLQKSTLKARDILRPELAELIEKTAIALPTAESWLITTLLPAIGSAVGGGQRLVVSPKSGYVVTPIFWSAIVAKSGRKKSPTQGAILKPLMELETDAFKRYKNAVQSYKNSVKQEDPEQPPEAPVRERFVTNSSTPEGLARILSESPNILRYTDELRGLFSFNQYKKVGDEEQFYLSLFNGEPVIVDRADPDKSIVANRPCAGITGTIQSGVLEKLQSKLGFDDASGLMARFLFCCEDSPLGYLDLNDEDNSAQQLQIVLKELYGAFRGMSDRDYLLSSEAKKYFQHWQHYLIDLASAEAHAGLAAVYPKIETYTARFALLLHVVNAMFVDRNPAVTISGETMEKAIVLAQYYLNQAKIIYGTNDPESKQDKALMALIELGRKKGVLTAREAKIGVRALREQTPAQIRELFTKLVELGHGSTEGEGIRAKWVYSETRTKNKTEPVSPAVKESTLVKPAIAESKSVALTDLVVKPATPIPIQKARWQPKEGDRVRYVGENEIFKAQYSGTLKVNSTSPDGVSCFTDDGRLSTWIPEKELQLLNSEVTA